jgi:GDPmannose 4,6-dehydratase
MSKKAFITGITSQDGYYLSQYLISLGYKVSGIMRRHSVSHTQDSRIADLDVETFYGDLLDRSSIERALEITQPDEIYHLAAQSNVRLSFEITESTVMINAIGTMNVLEAYRHKCPNARLYFAASSEMFGNSVDPDGFQRESTPFKPVSPYGAAKLFGFNMVNLYRESYGLFCSSNICFNHSSPKRGEIFVEQKICKAAVRIKLGLQDKLELGNLSSCRDIGHSRDYVKAMHMLLQQETPGCYVIATGVTKSVENMVEYVFTKLGLDWTQYVECLDKHKRPNELDYLKGDASRIKALGWKPEFTFETLMDDMLAYWLSFYNSGIPTVKIKGSDLVAAFNRYNGKK